MQKINDNTENLRQNMANAGIPDFGVGITVNGAGNVNFNANYRGQEVFNSENIDRSNAVPKVEKEIERVNDRYGYEWKGNDGFSTANNWLNGAGYLSGGIGATQIGMLEYRSSLPIMSKIGTLSRFSSTYKLLGTTSKALGGAANWAGAPLTIYLDYGSMQSKEISTKRFAYRTSGTISSIGVGAAIGSAFGGPYGAAGGAIISGGFMAGEYIYDGVNYIWDETLRQISNFENAIKSGWYPGR